MAEVEPPTGDTQAPKDEPPDGNERRPVGRPYTYTLEIGAQIIGGVRTGLSLTRAARLVEIDPETAERWKEKGEELGEGPLKEFADGVDSAEAEMQLHYEEQWRLRTASYQHWRDHARRLVRIDPGKYGPTAQARIRPQEVEVDLAITKAKIKRQREDEPVALAPTSSNEGDKNASPPESVTSDKEQNTPARTDEGKRGPGRSGKFTPTFCKDFLNLVRAGHEREAICVHLRVGSSTVRGWLNEGKHEPEGRYGELYVQTEKAESEAIAYHLSLIHEAAKHDLCAVKWLLDHVYRGSNQLQKKEDDLAEANLELKKIELKELEETECRAPEPVKLVLEALPKPDESERRHWLPPDKRSGTIYGSPIPQTTR